MLPWRDSLECRSTDCNPWRPSEENWKQKNQCDGTTGGKSDAHWTSHRANMRPCTKRCPFKKCFRTAIPLKWNATNRCATIPSIASKFNSHTSSALFCNVCFSVNRNMGKWGCSGNFNETNLRTSYIHIQIFETFQYHQVTAVLKCWKWNNCVHWMVEMSAILLFNVLSKPWILNKMFSEHFLIRK